MTAAKLIVQKFGGMSLATPAHIRAAAKRVAEVRASGCSVIAVVSAMGKTTDGLIEQAYSVSQKPNRRELDMLLSTGERVSMALFSMALSDALQAIEPRAKAISFTGSQAGILTDQTHSNARIIDVRAVRVREEIERGNVVILAGFQGVSPESKEITTLGRGGTDVTAVAMAAAFHAERCEILKEVPGVLSGDPKLIASPRILSHLSHRQLLDMTFWGAKVLHYRSVELAATHEVPLYVGAAHDKSQGTLVDGGTHVATFEKDKVLSINSHGDVRCLDLAIPQADLALGKLRELLDSHGLPMPQVLDVTVNGGTTSILFTGPEESLLAQVRALGPAVRGDVYATVTATCAGTHSTDLVVRMSAALAKAPVLKVLSGGMSLTFVVPQSRHGESAQTLHHFST